MPRKLKIRLGTALLLVFAVTTAHAGKPLKVFILAGQSNMQGQAKIHTIERLSVTPDSAEMYKEMTGGGGNYKTTKVDLEGYEDKAYTVVPNTHINYLRGHRKGDIEVKGPLTVGFGGVKNGVIGTEFTFGLYLQKHLNEPILIIKAAWGGKSLFKDFLSPGGTELIEGGETGEHYTLMIKYIRKVIAEIDKHHPSYNAKDGYEIAGFVWFQGWNDLVNKNVYPPNAENPKIQYALYSELLTAFIRDIRKELKEPDLPFVIGVIGVDGELALDHKQQYLRSAMAAPASLEEFKGTVKAVQTYPYWDTKAQALIDKVSKATYERVDQEFPQYKAKPRARAGAAKKLRKKVQADVLTEREKEFLAMATSNGGYHYLGSAYIYGNIGKAFANAMSDLLK